MVKNKIRNLHKETSSIYEIIHDLINPLTSLTLLLETDHLKNININEPKGKINSILKILSTLLRENSENTDISIQKELKDILTCLDSKIKRYNVSFIFLSKREIEITVPPFPFYKIFLNIISNAIDSYEGVPAERKREIVAHTYLDKENVIIDIEDFGCGFKNPIKKSKEIDMSGKPAKKDGHGYGLSIIKGCLKECRADIEFIKKEKYGTIVRIKFKRN